MRRGREVNTELEFYKVGAGSGVIEVAMVAFIFCEGENIRAGSRKRIESWLWPSSLFGPSLYIT